MTATVEHVLNWRFNKFMAQVEPELCCLSTKDALCRSKPAPDSGCSCEEFYGLTYDDQGWYHIVYADEFRTEVMAKHRHVPADECNIELYMNEDPMETIMETFLGEQRDFPIGATKVDVEWTGDEWGWKVSDDQS